MLAVLGEPLLDSGGAEAELGAGRTENDDVDRRRIEVNPLIDPSRPAVKIIARVLPALIRVLRQQADGGVENERDGDRRAENAKKSQSGHGFLWRLSAMRGAGEAARGGSGQPRSRRGSAG